MKKTVYVSVLVSVVALLFLLLAGPASAQPPQPMGGPMGQPMGGPMERPGWGDRMPGGWDGGAGQGSAEVESGDTAFRINFDVAGHKAHNGVYVVRYTDGAELARWSAHNGATDSGWITVELTRKTVWVEVVYYPSPHAAPTVMRIMNPAPGTSYGWISQGVAAAIEVAWPDMPVKSADSYMPLMPDGQPWPQLMGGYGGMMGGPGGPGGMGGPGGPGGMGGPGGPGGMGGPGGPSRPAGS